MRQICFLIAVVMLFAGEAIAQQDGPVSTYLPSVTYLDEQEPHPAPFVESESASPEIARLQFPVGGQPGYLQLPGGQTYQLVTDQSIDASIDSFCSPQPDAGGSSAGGSAGEAGQQDNGTNPAQNTTTFIASNEFYGLRGGNQINTSYARFKFPVYDKRGAFLLEVPYTFYDFTSQFPASPQVGGLGDVKFQFSYNTFVSSNQKFTVINFLEMYVPSADTVVLGATPGGNELTAFNLGTGKYVLGPGVGFVYAPQPNFIIAPLYFYEASVAGDDARREIRRGKWRVFAMYAWQSGWYTLPELQILTDYLSGNNDIYVAPEVGYSAKGTTLYVKPGFGIAPDMNDRAWGMEFGARIQF